MTAQSPQPGPTPSAENPSAENPSGNLNAPQDHRDPHDPCGHLHHLSDFVDGELEPDLCAQLESHLAGCENCRIVVDTLQRTVSLYRTLDQESDLSPEMEERLWRRFDLEDLLPLTRS